MGVSRDAIEGMLARGEHTRAKELLLREVRRGGAGEAEGASMLSRACLALGELGPAEFYARLAAERLPDDGRALHNLGNLLVNIGRAREAVPVLERARDLLTAGMPGGDLQPIIALANAHAALSAPAAGARVAREGLERHPEDPRLLACLAAGLHASGDVEAALPVALRARDALPGSASVAELVAAMMNYAPVATRDATLDAHRRYGEALVAELRAQGFTPMHPPRGARGAPIPTDRPVRIGLVSGDLRSHSVAYFARPILEHAGDLARVTCYHVGIREDNVSASLRKLAARWHHVPMLGARALAELIRRDALDVVIDLSGHTSGHRLAALAQRPAPIVATYFGYPNTTGVPGVDLRLTDSIADPPGAERWSTERLVRLDPVFCCYAPPDGHQDAGEDPGDTLAGDAGAVTFGCFGSLLKYNGLLLDLWARVLRETPGTRLVLMHHALGEEETRAKVVGRLAERGVEASRVEARGPAADARGTLPAYRRIDVSLDTWPYSGTTTVCESLWMGVPMVTLSGGGKLGEAGDRCAARVTGSILRAAGLDDLIARTEDEYVAIAQRLASPRARERLREIRRGLRQRMASGVLCDGRGFMGRLVAALRDAAAGAG